MFRLTFRRQLRHCSKKSLLKEQLKSRDQQLEVTEGILKRTVNARVQLYEEAEKMFEKELNKFSGTREEQIEQLRKKREKAQWWTDKTVNVKGKARDFIMSIFPIYFLIMVGSLFFWNATFFNSWDSGPQYY